MNPPNDPSSPAALARHFSEQARAFAVDRAQHEGTTRLLLLEHLQPVADERLLDLGTGAGHVALAFAPYVARAIAFDLAPAMLHAAALGARRLAAEEPDEPRAPLDRVRGDAHRLPFRSGGFGVVTIRHAARFFADLGAVLAEARRVLALGGRLGLAEPAVPDDDAETGEFLAALHRVHDPATVRLRSVGEWRAALEHARLRVDFVDTKAFELAEPRSLVAWFALGGGSSERLAEAKRLLLTAPRRIRDSLRVRTSGDDVTFEAAQLVMTAKRID